MTTAASETPRPRPRLALVFSLLLLACGQAGPGDGPDPALCGNGLLDPGELCDPQIATGPFACPVSCEDGDASTRDALVGSAAACNARCVHSAVTTCTDTCNTIGETSCAGGKLRTCVADASGCRSFGPATACASNACSSASTCNQRPVAVLSCPASASAGAAESFDGSGSSDADGAIGSYDFDFGDGFSAAGAAKTVLHGFPRPGLFTVTLTVADDLGAIDKTSCTVSSNGDSDGGGGSIDGGTASGTGGDGGVDGGGGGGGTTPDAGGGS